MKKILYLIVILQALVLNIKAENYVFSFPENFKTTLIFSGKDFSTHEVLLRSGNLFRIDAPINKPDYSIYNNKDYSITWIYPQKRKYYTVPLRHLDTDNEIDETLFLNDGLVYDRIGEVIEEGTKCFKLQISFTKNEKYYLYITKENYTPIKIINESETKKMIFKDFTITKIDQAYFKIPSDFKNFSNENFFIIKNQFTR